jgi:hypothetical protein
MAVGRLQEPRGRLLTTAIGSSALPAEGDAHVAGKLHIPKLASNREAQRIAETNKLAARLEQEALEARARELFAQGLIDETTPLDAQGRPYTNEQRAAKKKTSSRTGAETARRRAEAAQKLLRKKHRPYKPNPKHSRTR